MASCLSCTSSRVLHTGARAGALWCFVKRATVGESNACQSFTSANEKRLLELGYDLEALENDNPYNARLANANGIADNGRDHVLVKSDPKAHFDPLID